MTTTTTTSGKKKVANLRVVMCNDLLQLNELRRKQKATWRDIAWHEFELLRGSGKENCDTEVRIVTIYPLDDLLFDEQRSKVSVGHDCHICGDDGKILVHRLFIQSKSPLINTFFEETFLETGNPSESNPLVIILAGVTLEQLKVVVTLMYRGEIVVDEKELADAKMVINLMQLQLGEEWEPAGPISNTKKRKTVRGMRLCEYDESLDLSHVPVPLVVPAPPPPPPPPQPTPSSSSSSTRRTAETETVTSTPRDPYDRSHLKFEDYPLPNILKVPPGTITGKPRQHEPRIQRGVGKKSSPKKSEKQDKADSKSEADDDKPESSSGGGGGRLFDAMPPLITKVPPGTVKQLMKKQPRIKREPLPLALRSTRRGRKGARRSSKSISDDEDSRRKSKYERDDEYIPNHVVVEEEEEEEDDNDDEVLEVSSDDDEATLRPETKRTRSRRRSTKSECTDDGRPGTGRYSLRKRQPKGSHDEAKGKESDDDDEESETDDRTALEVETHMDQREQEIAISPLHNNSLRRTAEEADKSDESGDDDALPSEKPSPTTHQCMVCKELYLNESALISHLKKACLPKAKDAGDFEKRYCSSCKSHFTGVALPEFLQHLERCSPKGIGLRHPKKPAASAEICTGGPPPAAIPSSSNAARGDNVGVGQQVAGDEGGNVEPSMDVVVLPEVDVIMDCLDDEQIITFMDMIQRRKEVEISRIKLEKGRKYVFARKRKTEQQKAAATKKNGSLSQVKGTIGKKVRRGSTSSKQGTSKGSKVVPRAVSLPSSGSLMEDGTNLGSEPSTIGSFFAPPFASTPHGTPSADVRETTRSHMSKRKTDEELEGDKDSKKKTKQMKEGEIDERNAITTATTTTGEPNTEMEKLPDEHEPGSSNTTAENPPYGSETLSVTAAKLRATLRDRLGNFRSKFSTIIRDPNSSSAAQTNAETEATRKATEKEEEEEGNNAVETQQQSRVPEAGRSDEVINNDQRTNSCPPESQESGARKDAGVEHEGSSKQTDKPDASRKEHAKDAESLMKSNKEKTGAKSHQTQVTSAAENQTRQAGNNNASTEQPQRKERKKRTKSAESQQSKDPQGQKPKRQYNRRPGPASRVNAPPRATPVVSSSYATVTSAGVIPSPQPTTPPFQAGARGQTGVATLETLTGSDVEQWILSTQMHQMQSLERTPASQQGQQTPQTLLHATAITQQSGGYLQGQASATALPRNQDQHLIQNNNQVSTSTALQPATLAFMASSTGHTAHQPQWQHQQQQQQQQQQHQQQQQQYAYSAGVHVPPQEQQVQRTLHNPQQTMAHHQLQTTSVSSASSYQYTGHNQNPQQLSYSTGTGSLLPTSSTGPTVPLNIRPAIGPSSSYVGMQPGIATSSAPRQMMAPPLQQQNPVRAPLAPPFPCPQQQHVRPVGMSGGPPPMMPQSGMIRYPGPAQIQQSLAATCAPPTTSFTQQGRGGVMQGNRPPGPAISAAAPPSYSGSQHATFSGPPSYTSVMQQQPLQSSTTNSPSVATVRLSVTSQMNPLLQTRFTQQRPPSPPRSQFEMRQQQPSQMIMSPFNSPQMQTPSHFQRPLATQPPPVIPSGPQQFTVPQPQFTTPQQQQPRISAQASAQEVVTQIIQQELQAQQPPRQQQQMSTQASPHLPQAATQMSNRQNQFQGQPPEQQQQQQQISSQASVQDVVTQIIQREMQGQPPRQQQQMSSQASPHLPQAATHLINQRNPLQVQPPQQQHHIIPPPQPPLQQQQQQQQEILPPPPPLQPQPMEPEPPAPLAMDVTFGGGEDVKPIVFRGPAGKVFTEARTWPCPDCGLEFKTEAGRNNHQLQGLC